MPVVARLLLVMQLPDPVAQHAVGEAVLGVGQHLAVAEGLLAVDHGRSPVDWHEGYGTLVDTELVVALS